jgi:hypothetical protein
MSMFLLLGVGAALALPALTRGSYIRLVETRWEWGAILGLGVAVQVALEHVSIPRSHYHDIGFGLLVGSYVLLLAFCLRNSLRTGMIVVALGIGANFLAIVANQGMPVYVPADWQAHGGVTATTVKHHPADERDHLHWLSDVIVLRSINEEISFGDLIMVVGLLDVSYQGSRRRRRVARLVEPPESTPQHERVVDLGLERELETVFAAIPAAAPAPAEAPVEQPVEATVRTSTAAAPASGSGSEADAHDVLERFEHA